jgi:hypothetical protein
VEMRKVNLKKQNQRKIFILLKKMEQ